jgi:RHH-type transcriptional regulator, rel operon repressor / antitoxin RelB
MTESTTLTIRLDPAVKTRLDDVAERTHRSESDLAAEAIAEFVAIQEWQIEAIEKSVAAADRGELVPHEEVVAWAASFGSGAKRARPRAK